MRSGNCTKVTYWLLLTKFTVQTVALNIPLTNKWHMCRKLTIPFGNCTKNAFWLPHRLTKFTVLMVASKHETNTYSVLTAKSQLLIVATNGLGVWLSFCDYILACALVAWARAARRRTALCRCTDPGSCLREGKEPPSLPLFYSLSKDTTLFPQYNNM